MKCSIVKALLPNYRDKLTSEAANADIREHLMGCENCRAFYETISEEDFHEEMEKERENAWELLGKLKARMRRNRIIAAVSACVLLTGLLIFTKTYELPLPYSSSHMSVETFRGVFLPMDSQHLPEGEEPGETLWDLDFIDLETTKEVLEGRYEIVESAKLCYQGLNHVGLMSESRTIERDEEEVNIVYYCYYMTLWDSVFHGVFAPYSESGSSSVLTRIQEGVRRDVPRMTEVYYMPVRNLSGKVDDLSDAEFEALRKDGYLVFSGVIVG